MRKKTIHCELNEFSNSCIIIEHLRLRTLYAVGDDTFSHLAVRESRHHFEVHIKLSKRRMRVL